MQQGDRYFRSTIAYSEGTLTQTVIQNGYSDIARLNVETIRVFGANGTINSILVNGERHFDFEILPSHEIYVHNLKVPVNSRYTITFTTTDSNSSSGRLLFGYNSIVCSILVLLAHRKLHEWNNFRLEFDFSILTVCFISLYALYATIECKYTGVHVYLCTKV